MSTDRRQLLIGAACVAAAGLGFAARPRRKVALLGSRKMTDLVPSRFGAWKAHDVDDLVAPKEEGSLASRLYNQTVGRVYTHAQSNVEIMMLLAYGGTQSDDLQLHRPEVCYPAFGFTISRNEGLRLPLPGGGGKLPMRRLVAVAPGRQENIVYWSRLGEFLPINGEEQRADRFKNALSGIVPDGVLARFSILSQDPISSWEAIQGFVVELLTATSKEGRPPLIGTALAAQMARGVA